MPITDEDTYYGNFDAEFRNFWTNGSYYCIFAGLGLLPDRPLPYLAYDRSRCAGRSRSSRASAPRPTDLRARLPSNYEFLTQSARRTAERLADRSGAGGVAADRGQQAVQVDRLVQAVPDGDVALHLVAVAPGGHDDDRDLRQRPVRPASAATGRSRPSPASSGPAGSPPAAAPDAGRSRASCPLPASAMAKPSSPRTCCRLRRMPRSSSTINTVSAKFISILLRGSARVVRPAPAVAPVGSAWAGNRRHPARPPCRRRRGWR